MQDLLHDFIQDMAAFGSIVAFVGLVAVGVGFV